MKTTDMVTGMISLMIQIMMITISRTRTMTTMMIENI